ncbi:T9SS C-terminal target domain-containing protein [Aquimarina sp. AD1]|uniref:T9SS type A sorting domain-containing protein n=1 Tax=Aquimarina sp. (strain AD1) TaxID=1714848 RepID=UPI000E52A455|nr:T9SS type A sorting domain-containing protein [Aquimarina sp. AD1]AXT55162.1 T9SS C-terminal target domain-containing protein [Aquimarina sp. AD1]RKN14120.1 T9SS C-terminal target domain-containing protein [Aquimarina sp. AD1]
MIIKNRISKIMVVILLFFNYALVNAQTIVSSLVEFREAVQNSNQNIILESGDYYLEDLPSNSRVINCTGSGNTIDMTGARINTLVGSIREVYFIISGDNNILRNGVVEDFYKNGLDEVTDFSAYNNDRDNLAYGLRGDPIMSITGNQNLVEGLEMIVKGSFPYGYGSQYGIGSQNTFGLSKRCGILITGSDGGGIGNTLDGITMYHYAFGHGIFMQSGASETTIKNCYIEGRIRLSNDIYNDTETYDLPYITDYKFPAGDGSWRLPFEESYDIPLNHVYPLSEDGIRSYNNTGSVTVENCTVKQMRGGIRLYLASSATVTNSQAIDCGSGGTNYNMPAGGTIIGSSGNFTYAPLSDFRLSRSRQNIEMTIIPSPNAIGPHNIADILGNDHNIIFHRIPGPLDLDEERAIVVYGDNSTIVNETEYTIILESGATGNTVSSCGLVINNGSNNSISQLNDCDTVPPPSSSFTPDPNKTYYIDNPYHNLRLASNGSSEDAYTTSTQTTGDDVAWKFVAKGNGSWHIQRAAGGTKPRLRTDNSEFADMQATTNSGTYTYYNFTQGTSANTHFITLPDGPSGRQRLQIDNSGLVRFMSSSLDGTWESFSITEITPNNNGSSTIVHITKRNATGFAVDGMGDGADGQNVYLWSANQNNVNQQWIEIDRGNGYYSYQKIGTDYCIDGNSQGANRQNVYLWSCAQDNQNQHWKKVSVGGGAYKLIKRNAPGYALDGGSNGTNAQNIQLYDALNTSQNLQWIITPIDDIKAPDVSNDSKVILYPNPVINTVTIKGAANSIIRIYDINGKVLSVKHISNDIETMDVSSLAQGLYYIKVNGDTNVSTIKISKK